MRRPSILAAIFVTAMSATAIPALAQEGPPTRYPQHLAKHLAPPNQVVAIRAGRLFDSKSAAMLINQVILIKGDRIVNVGPSVEIPAGTRVIDLSAATVMPGMIDAHVHVVTGGATATQRALIAQTNAQIDLEAGFTTLLDMDFARRLQHRRPARRHQ